MTQPHLMKTQDLVEQAIAEAITLQAGSSHYVETGEFWISGGVTPKTAGRLINLSWVAEDAMRALLSRIQALEAENAGLRGDADRFRALMRCGKIKMQGSSGVDPRTGERNGNNVHFGAEFWPDPPKPEHIHLDGGPQSTAWGVACLVALADAIIEREAAAEARSALSLTEGEEGREEGSARSQPSGTGPSDLVDPQSQHSDGGRG